MEQVRVIQSFPIWLPQTQTWLYNQVRFVPDQVQNHIVCEMTQNLDQFSVPNIHSLSEASPWRSLWDKGLRDLKIRRHLGFLVEQAKRHKVQLLHSHFGNVGWENIGAARRVGMKHVVTFYGLDVNYLPKLDPCWYERYVALFEQVDRVLCEGPYMAQCIVDLGCPKSKVIVHHLGVSLDEIAFNPRVWTPGEPLRVLLAASFREKKGIPYALEALGRLQHDVPLEITLIGDADEESRSQAEKRKILAVIHKHNLISKMRMPGYQPHAILLEESYKHHVFLSPSITACDGDTEGGAPVSIIEMMAIGMPVVSTKHCDIQEVVNNGVTGLLAEERDVNGLVRHIKWLVDHPEQWSIMAEAGRKHVETEFNARIQGEHLKGIYESALNEC